MRDGRTRKMDAAEGNAIFAQFLAKFQVSLVRLAGGAKGTEYVIDREQVTLGRGPGVDLAFDDSAMSCQHAALEFRSGGFQVRDLGSTNGTLLNGDAVQVGELKHGDRFQLGEHLFQIVIEERDSGCSTYVLHDV